MSSSTPPPARSVKIGADERTGWSSERPRRDGAPPRPANIAVRHRVLRPSDRMRYNPGSLLVILGAAAAEPARFAERVVEERSAVLSMAKVRALLEGRVPPEQAEQQAPQLLEAAVAKRLTGKASVALALDDFDPELRERYVRLAHGHGRPRHLVLIEAPRDAVTDEERGPLQTLRRALDEGELGQEGFSTSMRLGGAALTELKRIVFQPPPRED